MHNATCGIMHFRLNYFFLCLFFRKRFFRLWVAILWRFLFLPLGIFLYFKLLNFIFYFGYKSFCRFKCRNIMSRYNNCCVF